MDFYMSDLDIILLVFSAICYIYAYWLKRNSIEGYGVCLENWAAGILGAYVIFEYEVVENGELKKYIGKGFTLLHLKKGKQYRILINKKNYNKVEAYNVHIGWLVWGGIMVILVLIPKVIALF